MKPVRLQLEATDEMAAAAAWYEEQRAELGQRFVAAIEDAAKRVQASPSRFPVAAYGARRCLVRKFPYCLIYKVLDEEIVVVAVMHLHRAPNYWQERL